MYLCRMKQLVQYPGIGLIEFCTRRGTRGVKYCVTNDRVRITVDPRLNAKNVFPLSEKCVAWILASRKKLAQAENSKVRFAPDTALETNRFTVKFQQRSDIRQPFTAERNGDTLTINYQPGIDFDNEDNQLKIKHLIAYFLRIEAKNKLPQRLHALAEKYGFRFAQVRINSAQTRWGSCSTRKHINLSYNLMLLPDELIDLVLVHELCHTREMNHGARFEQMMRNIFTDYDTLTAELKKHHPLNI